MDRPDVTAHFSLLCEFELRVNFAIVILAEAVFCLIFGAVQTPEYRALRDRRLPPVRRVNALNITDPLTTNNNSAYRHDTIEYLRNALFDKVLEGGLFPVSISAMEYGMQCRFYVSSLAMDIPTHVARELLLHEVANPQVFVTFEITHDSHEQPYALKSIPQDDASKLGIKIGTEYGDSAFYLQKNAASAVADANALFDFLQGKLVNITTMTPMQWGWDRYPFCGPFRQSVSRTT